MTRCLGGIVGGICDYKPENYYYKLAAWVYALGGHPLRH